MRTLARLIKNTLSGRLATCRSVGVARHGFGETIHRTYLRPLVVTGILLASVVDQGNLASLEDDDGRDLKKHTDGAKLTVKIVDALHRSGVEYVAIDFDKTLINIHTGGEWWRDSSSILPHIRPQLRILVRVLHQQGQGIAMVSFSRQMDIIRACLVNILGSEDQAAKIPILGYPAFWSGKQTHLVSLSRDPSKLLLIDDSEWNVLLAKRSGAHAVWFDPDNPDELWQNILLELETK